MNKPPLRHGEGFKVNNTKKRQLPQNLCRNVNNSNDDFRLDAESFCLKKTRRNLNASVI